VKGAVVVQIISVPLNTKQHIENLEIFQAAARIIHAEHLYDRYNQNQRKSEKKLASGQACKIISTKHKAMCTISASDK